MSAIKIIQGEDRSITVKLKDGNGADFDLTLYDSVEACFKGTSGSITKSLGSGIIKETPNECGKITISLEDADTLLLETGTQSFEVIIDDLSETDKKRIIQFENSLNIVERIC